jgi:amino acid transporter
VHTGQQHNLFPRFAALGCLVSVGADRPQVEPPSSSANGLPGPERRYRSLGYRLKRVALGPALKTSQMHDERIRKRIALAVFSSDPISSTAYATEEMLLVLVLAGTAATRIALPLSLAIVGLLAVLILSYRQIIANYSSSGGAYVVTKDNFGGYASQVAGAALVIDYVLTVAVSVSSGTAALISAFESLEPLRVPIAALFVLLLALGNLRGIKEAGRIFAVPTYLYVVSIGVVVIWGVYRTLSGSLGPIVYSGPEQGELASAGGAITSVSLFLILHAFSSGTTALTGVEAISNGVSAFRKPQARNAQRTLVAMGLIMGTLFVGVTWLATHFHAVPFESGSPTLLAQIARHVLGGGPLFLLVQIATLLILVLAANTSFSSFPLLANFAAGDSILPKQLRKRGHRLVYSNGIIVLTAAALFLVLAFRADTHLLIPLYAIGVVTSFTLAQAGMAKFHLVRREPGWRKGLLINGFGGLVTGVVLIVLVITKFADGAWMVCVAIPAIVYLLRRVQRAYAREDTQLELEAAVKLPPPKPRHEVLVFVDDLDRAALEALQYARQLNPLSITAVHFAVDPDEARELSERWSRVNLPIALDVVDCPDRNLLACTQDLVAELQRADTEVTVLVSKRGYGRFWTRILHDRTSAGLVRLLGSMEGVNVTIVPYQLGHQPLVGVDGSPHEPGRG